MTIQWHVIRTKNKAEKVAFYDVGGQQIEVFCPARVLRSIWRGERSTRTESVFRGYIFAKFDAGLDLSRVLETDAVEGVLRAGGGAGRPSVIPQELIDEIREAANAGVFNSTPWGWLKPGDIVRVKEGPFAGIIAKIVKARSGRQMEVLINAISRSTVPLDNLEKICV